MTMALGKLMTRIIFEAYKYPLPRRIAARLYLDKVSSDTFLEDCKGIGIPDPLVLVICNELRDLEHGRHKLNIHPTGAGIRASSLRELTNKL